MLDNNAIRNKMRIISCKHKGVVDLICSSLRTQKVVGLGGAINQMKKQKMDTNLELQT
jgi:hypothetical protein